MGVFVCIRCSGIHRGMGTHISRVKSVDLDAWTDEQLQSILKWGNAKANKYWEAKLAEGHIPSEAKIENFIRTKYESKRWVMDGPMPDPASLDVEGDDDVVSLIVLLSYIARSILSTASQPCTAKSQARCWILSTRCFYPYSATCTSSESCTSSRSVWRCPRTTHTT